MSTHLIVKTLKFCTNCVDNLTLALRTLNLQYTSEDTAIIVNGKKIELQGDVMFMSVSQDDKASGELFTQINSKVAEIEAQIRFMQAERNEALLKEAKMLQEKHKVSKIQREQERLEYEKRRLQLEQDSFVEAKKHAIIEKAKSLGYVVEEKIDNGAVKLKLIKRIY